MLTIFQTATVLKIWLSILLGSLSLSLQITVNFLKMPPHGPQKTKNLGPDETDYYTDQPSVPMSYVQPE